MEKPDTVTLCMMAATLMQRMVTGDPATDAKAAMCAVNTAEMLYNEVERRYPKTTEETPTVETPEQPAS